VEYPKGKPVWEGGTSWSWCEAVTFVDGLERADAG
jgi:hypothetical protein